jgi:FAD/FMN-containing dehydrogenase
MRGAADSIGIVTIFELQTHPAPAEVVNWSLSFGSVTKTVSKSVNAFLQVQKMALNASVVSADLGFNVHLGGSTFDIGGTYFGSLDDFNNKIKPKMLENLPTPDGTNQFELDWPASLLSLDGGVSLQSPSPYNVQANFFAKSVVVPQTGFTKESLKNLFQYIADNPNPPIKYFTLVDLWGGAGSAINTKSADFSAFAHHDAFWVVQNYGLVANNETFPQKGIKFISGLNSAVVQGLPSWSAYSNYADPTLSRDDAHRLYYGDDVYGKLQKIKTNLDPKNLFSNPQSI